MVGRIPSGKAEAVDRAELLLDLRKSKTISGLRIDWDQHTAGAVDMAISLDGKAWKQGLLHLHSHHGIQRGNPISFHMMLPRYAL